LNLKKEEIKMTIEKIRKIMTSRRKVKGSKKDYLTVLQASKTGDYGEVFKTKLYQKYSVEYCELLVVINIIT
jgi:hypothetical protein